MGGPISPSSYSSHIMISYGIVPVKGERYMKGQL
jgi:hypothetical protein